MVLFLIIIGRESQIQDWDFRDSGFLKILGLIFLGFKIAELQDFLRFSVFWDPEPHPSLDSYSLLTKYFGHCAPLNYSLRGIKVRTLQVTNFFPL